jgi:hypothetical protein
VGGDDRHQALSASDRRRAQGSRKSAGEGPDQAEDRRNGSRLRRAEAPLILMSCTVSNRAAPQIGRRGAPQFRGGDEQ